MNLPSHIQITNLIYRYAELVDAGDVDGLLELFGDAEIHRRDGVLRGAEMRSNFGRLPIERDGKTKVRHVTTNLILDIDEDGCVASARSYATVLKCTAGDQIEAIFSNRYHDEFAATNGIWRFVVRRYLDSIPTASTAHLMMDGASPDDGMPSKEEV